MHVMETKWTNDYGKKLIKTFYKSNKVTITIHLVRTVKFNNDQLAYDATCLKLFFDPTSPQLFSNYFQLCNEISAHFVINYL